MIMGCDTMTSAERMGALMNGERPDRVPVIPMASGHVAEVCGRPLVRVWNDPEEAFRCHMLAAEMYGYDGTPLWAYASAGAWEFGGEIEMPVKKYSGAPTVARTPIQNEDDVYTLQVPGDITRAGAQPIALAFARIAAEHDFPVSVQIGSPFTYAGSIIGEERMMSWLIKKPELVHIVLDKASDYLIKVAEYYVKEFGAHRLSAFHGAATETNKLISPKQFETFALPYLQKVNARVMELGVKSLVHHICGEQNKNLKFWQQVPMTKQTVISIGREVALETAMELFPVQIIAGNVDPTLVQEGTADEVLRQARQCIEAAKHHPGGFILMPGCELPPQAPPVNVYQLVKAAREFGRY
jgi:uroporphyrinogen decarboxylase